MKLFPNKEELRAKLKIYFIIFILVIVIVFILNLFIKYDMSKESLVKTLNDRDFCVTHNGKWKLFQPFTQSNLGPSLLVYCEYSGVLSIFNEYIIEQEYPEYKNEIGKWELLYTDK